MTKPSTDDLFPKFEEIQNTAWQAYYAIGVSTILEKVLIMRLSRSMPNLSKRLHGKIFEGYGPLNSFSAKIDIAYALGLVHATTRRDLHAIREIRNRFAHSLPGLTFDSDEIKKLFAKFPDYDPKRHSKEYGRGTFFLQKIMYCMNKIYPIELMLDVALAKDSDGPRNNDTSPGKSQ